MKCIVQMNELQLQSRGHLKLVESKHPVSGSRYELHS